MSTTTTQWTAAASARNMIVPGGSVPVTPVTSHYRQPPPIPAWQPGAVTWPAGSATVTVPVAAMATASAAPPVRAGALPVWLGPSTTHPTGQPRDSAPAAAIPTTAQVSVAPAAQASALGVRGVVVTVRPTTSGAGGARLTLDYRGFAHAFGGDWADRLHLVELPACATSTPAKPACRIATPLPSTVNEQSGTIAADIPLSGAATAPAAASPTVIAATSGPSGSAGDYTATSLKPSGSWQAGGSADAFAWSYPISVPPVPGGLEPSVSLSYDSQSVDGLTSSTNNQPSWIGDGWDYSPGFVERSYQSCHQNPAGPTQTQDNCWSADNTLTMSLNGQTNILVPDNTTAGLYHPQNDANERVQYLGTPNAPGGVPGNEHFVVTTDDGTRYYFGLNELPGWASGDATTNSVWTEPVYSTASGQPCYNATFANSWCSQAYRWNLDYVVDTHSDAVSYFYQTETNSYAADNGSTATASYVRGGELAKIQYGQRDQAVYTTQPAAQVIFQTGGRCDQSTCDVSTLSQSTAAQWPDVPEDLACNQNAACQVQSPAFWSDYVLTGIQTYSLIGSTETQVDSWALTHAFPDTGDADTPVEWLASITRTGQDTTAGGSSASISLPPVTFRGTNLDNRSILTNGYSPITRQRLSNIVTETGELLTVDYSSAACGSSQPDPSQDNALCFPSYWTPFGAADPILDWFNKFIVHDVNDEDPTGGSANDTIVTTYTPAGTPAWHYDDSPTTPNAQRTWNDFRGFGGMTVTTGTGNDPVTRTAYTYFRGMNGDTLPGGATRSASVGDSRGDPAVTDSDQFGGETYETVVYDGGNVVSDTISDPWSSAPTASHPVSGLPDERAFHVDVADTRVYTPLTKGGTRETEVDYTRDGYGRPTHTNDQGDVSIATDDLCTTTSYADNTDANILDLTAEASTVSDNCSTTPNLPADQVTDTRTYYDNSTTLGAAPTIGDATMNQQVMSYTGTTANLATTTSAYDQYGRATSTTNPDGRTTRTGYTPATGAEPTSIAVTDPANLVTTTTYDPTRDLPTRKTDPASYVTTEQYDALGRLTSVFEPGQPANAGEANLKYAYTVSDSGPSIVDTYTLLPDNQDSTGLTYQHVETLYDSMLRAREVQTQTPDNTRTITDTVYDTDGWVAQTDNPYHDGLAVSPTLVQPQVGKVPSVVGYAYDGTGRKTAAISYHGTGSGNAESWRTTYSYSGDSTTTIPPAGATATTTFTDARGNTTDLYQYHTGVPADPVHDPSTDYSDTRYTATPAGKPATITDAAGNKWSYQYDLLGHQTTAVDPDTGTSTTTYDNAGLVKSVTDGRGKQTTTTYDNDARKTAEYDTTGNAAPSAADKIAAWSYDSVAKGLPATTTSISNGDVYTQSVQGYNSFGKPTAVQNTLTGPDAALLPAGGYTVTYGYANEGTADHETEPAIGGLPKENVATTLQFGDPVELSSTGGTTYTYVSSLGYTEFEQPALYALPAGNGNQVGIGMTYDPQTQALTNVETTAGNPVTVVDNLTYTYGDNAVSGGSGLVTSTVDNNDTQCFAYDYATRLAQAWTATDQCAATPAPGSSATVGGPVPYWQSWTYDAAGDRSTQVDHDTSGNTANDTTTTYNYPAAGQPHTLTSTSATGPNAAANTATYGYDPGGDTTTISGGAAGSQTLTWDDQGKLASDTTPAGGTGYVYDADGNLLIRRDPGQTTLFLGDQQLVRNTATGVITGTRYYAIGGTTIASRTGAANPVYLVPDRQGTDELAIASDTEAVTRRQYLPFGGVRGTPPSVWPGGDKGYVGGTPDPTTSLENLGDREYDPATGRFLSPDPVLEAADPTQLGGYDYSGNDPVTNDDPTGQCPVDRCGYGISNNGHIATTGPADPQNPNAGSYRNGRFVPAPARKPSQRPVKPVRHANTAGGKAAGEMAPNYHPDPSAGPPATEVGAVVFLNLVVLAGNLFGDEEVDPATIEMDKHLWDAAEAQISQDEGCGPNSFVGDTGVLMADGSTKPIDQIKVGDRITNAVPGAPQGSTDQTHTVTAVHVTYTDRDYTDVTVNTPHGPATIHGTAHHLYWDATTNRWTEADQLRVGDQLQTADGAHVTILATHNHTAVTVTYNLTIDTLHTYYVEAGQTPILVHNNNGDESCTPNNGLGNLIKVNKPDAAADALAERIGGVSRVKFENDPKGREFDAVSDTYVAQAKPAGMTLGSQFRNQAKATFDVAAKTGRIPYFQFAGPPDPAVTAKLLEYGQRYGIDPVIEVLGPQG